MPQLQELIGVERELSVVNWAIRDFAGQLGAGTIGGLHVHCCDETESEAAESFQRWFAASALPELEAGRRAILRTANQGGRYEWGTAALIDIHFATAASQASLKLLVLKISAHVGFRWLEDGPDYGWFDRYGVESPCCDVLETLLADGGAPPIRDLAAAFAHDGYNRLAILRDLSRIPSEQRALFTAIVSARLQAERALIDINGRRPKTPTVFLILPTVTVNRAGPDNEILVGQFGVDWTGARPTVRYRGLSDDPARYRLRHERQLAVVTDAHWPPP